MPFLVIRQMIFQLAVNRLVRGVILSHANGLRSKHVGVRVNLAFQFVEASIDRRLDVGKGFAEFGFYGTTSAFASCSGVTV